MTKIQRAIKEITEGNNLPRDLAIQTMDELMSGNCSEISISAFLTGLKIKGETIDEIASFAKVMREKCLKINPEIDEDLIDVCGTGGAPLKTFNISTVSSFVMAGAGCKVAKHGNRSNTSKSGSADLLEALGVNLDADVSTVEKAIQDIGIGFLYAPNLHPAMKYAVGTRKELGIGTVFNILGPLTNPATADRHLMGVFQPELVEKFPHVLKNLGVRRAFVVHGMDGIDEISTLGETYVGELRQGEVNYYRIRPEQFGIKRTTHKNIANLPPRESAQMAVKVLRGEVKDERTDIILLNTGAGVYTAGKADSIEEGLEVAVESIESGKAYGKLIQLIGVTGGEPTFRP